MHQAILNIVRSMIFAIGLPVRFRGDAADYAVYILHKSPTIGKLKHISPIQMLTKKPVLSDIVVLGLPSIVHEDSKKTSPWAIWEGA